jgi:hypothetical protein
MSMISTCVEPGCSTLCIGLFCIEHDARPQVEFPRGRPWPPLGVLQPPAATSSVMSGGVPEPALTGALSSVLPAA